MKGANLRFLLVFSVFFFCGQVHFFYGNPHFVAEFSEKSFQCQNRNGGTICAWGPVSLCVNPRINIPSHRRHCEAQKRCVTVKEFCSDNDAYIAQLAQNQELNDDLKNQLEFIATDCNCKNLSEHIVCEAKRIKKEQARTRKVEIDEELRLKKLEKEALTKIKAEREVVQKKSVQEIEQLIQINPSFSLKSDPLTADDQTRFHDNGSWSGRLARRCEAIIHVTKNQMAYEHKTFSISTEFKEFVVLHGGDAQQYGECIGNQLQQVLHEELIEAVNEASDLSECDVEKKLQAMHGILVGFAGSGCQQNKSGQMIKALQLADLCWKLLEYGDVVIKVAVDYVDGQDCRIALKIVHEQVVMHLGCLLKDEITIRNYKDFKRITRLHGNKYIRDGFRRVQDNIVLVSDHLLSGCSSGHTKVLRSFFGAATRDLQTCPQTKDEFEAFYECCDGISIKLANDAAWKFRKFVEKRQNDTQKILNDACFKRLEFETHKQQELQDYIDDQMVELAIQHVDSDDPFDADEISDVQEISEENLKSMLTCPSEYEAMWSHRIARRQALAQELLEGEQVCKSEFFEISPACAEFLELHDCDSTVFEQCTGNEFQQSLHKEFVEVIADAAGWPESQSEQQQELVNATQALLTSLAQQGCRENKAGNIVESTMLADACKCLQIYGKSVALGVWDGTVDTAEIVLRPDQAIMGILSLGWAAISNAALLSYDSVMSDIHYCLEGALYENKGRWKEHEQRFRDKIDSGVKLVKKAYKAFQETSGPDRVRLATRIATNFALHGKAIQLRGAALGAVKPFASKVLNPLVDKAKGWLAKANPFKQKMPTPALANAHGITPTETTRMLERFAEQEGRTIQKLTTQTRKIIKNATTYEPCDCCKQAGLAGRDLIRRGCGSCRGMEIAREKALRRAVKKSKRIFEQLERKGRELSKNGTAIKLRNITVGLSESQFTKLRRFFGKIVKSPGIIKGQAIPKQFLIDENFLRHIFMGKLEIYAKKMAQMGGELSGFHHSHKWQDLQKKLFRFVNIEKDVRTGIVEGWIPTGGTKMIRKTFFPASWSPEKVVEKIVEALQNIEKGWDRGTRFGLIGKTNCGVPLEFVAERSGRLVTTFPRLDLI